MCWFVYACVCLPLARDASQEVLHTLDIADAARLQWVPDHDDEKLADHEIQIYALKEVGLFASVKQSVDVYKTLRRIEFYTIFFQVLYLYYIYIYIATFLFPAVSELTDSSFFPFIDRFYQHTCVLRSLITI